MKRFAVVIVTAFLLLLVLVSCSKESDEAQEAAVTLTPSVPPVIVSPTPTSSPASTPAETPEPDSITEVADLTYTETFDVASGYTLVVTVRYPETGTAAIDDYYTDEYENFKIKAENLADELRTYDEPNAASTEYSLEDDYEIVRNSNDVFSVHRIVFQYTGGAHGNHADVCDNFLISDGKRLTLDDIFDCSQDEYIAAICAVFDKFIDTHSSGDDNYFFFNDAKSMLRDNFPLGTFCLTDTGLNFYISPYFIAPYSTGTVVIPVFWDDLSVPVREI